MRAATIEPAVYTVPCRRCQPEDERYNQRVYSTATAKLDFSVITVNPEDVQYNRESVVQRHHYARGPSKTSQVLSVVTPERLGASK